jgi:CO/xanthine dehydrogenase FAD-binding subunit
MISVAVSFSKPLNKARIVLTGVASGPLRVKEAEELFAKNPVSDIASQVGELVQANVNIVSAIGGSVGYKKQIIRVLVRDAVKKVQGSIRE